MDIEIFRLAEKLGELLQAKGMKVAVAESCTGGGICQAITDVPGSSVWFDRGFVTYSNEAKKAMLAVNSDSLDQFGAVSRVVAIEMVNGVLQNSLADLAVSVTGIAGPGGGTEEKPVGTVFIAWQIKNQMEQCKKFQFVGDRSGIRLQTVRMALIG